MGFLDTACKGIKLLLLNIFCLANLIPQSIIGLFKTILLKKKIKILFYLIVTVFFN